MAPRAPRVTLFESQSPPTQEAAMKTLIAVLSPPAAGVRKAPRHEIAVGERRRCRNYGDFAAGSGVDVVERGGNVGNFAGGIAGGMCVN